MNNNLKQQVSELLDDELDPQAALRLLNEALEEVQITKTLNRYAMISQALKNDGLVFSNDSFLKNVSAQIEREPTYLLPNRKRQTTHNRRYGLIALAASIAIVAVLGAQGPGQPPATDINNASMAMANLSSGGTKAGLETTKPNQAPLNERIYDYLQAHNNGVYTSGDPSLQPFVKVTTYSDNR